MPKERSPNRDKAYELYKINNGDIPLVSIAEELNETAGTVRGWKSKDKWDSKLNGTFQTKNTERSIQNSKKSKANKKITSSIYQKNDSVPIMSTNQNSETNSNTKTNKKGAPKGNKNAVGNSGGNGAIEGNKNALSTGEYESIIFKNILGKEERSIFGRDIDVKDKLLEQLHILEVREYRIFQRIKEFEEGERLSLSAVTIVSEEDGTKKSNTTTMRAKHDEILKLEDALTRVESAILRVIDKLRKYDIDEDRLSIERDRLQLYRDKLKGTIDLEELLDDEVDDI